MYWVQPGYQYRPPPIIKNSQYINGCSSCSMLILCSRTAEEETKLAFERHFETQINLYREQVS